MLLSTNLLRIQWATVTRFQGVPQINITQITIRLILVRPVCLSRFFLSSFWWIPDFRHKQQLSGTCKFSVWSYSRCTSKKFDSAIRSCQNQFPNQVNLTSFVAQKCSLEWFSNQFQEGYSVFFQSGGCISEKHIHQRRFFSIMAWKFCNNGTYCAICCHSIHRPRTVEEGTTILDFKVRNECIKRTVKILAFIRFYKWIKVKAQVVEDFWQDR